MENKFKVLNQILQFDILVHQQEFIRIILEKRMKQVGIKDYNNYFELLKNPEEQDKLKKYLYISFSIFFRSALSFEYISNCILPLIYEDKISANKMLRVWSAGCASGEEPYSIAIILNELLSSRKPISYFLLASDIDKNIILKAQKGQYPIHVLGNMKLSYLNNFFIKKNDLYYLSDEIKKMVFFAEFDLTGSQNYVPSESIYGNFDVILCSNVLIYYNTEIQVNIIGKLYKALEDEGYLILGNTEVLPDRFLDLFEKVVDFCPIYRKIR